MSTWIPSDQATYHVARMIRDGATTVREIRAQLVAQDSKPMTVETIGKVLAVLKQNGHITLTRVRNRAGTGGWHWVCTLVSMPPEPPSRVWESDAPVRRQVRAPIQGSTIAPQPPCLLAEVWK